MAMPFYVIPFNQKDMQENRDVYFNVYLELALLVTAHELEEKPHRLKDTIHADVRVYRGARSSTITEYDNYVEVYFLNEGAMRIFKDREALYGEVWGVLKIVAGDELPKEVDIKWQKPYLPLT
jgi:hypothetical protein